MYSVMMSDLVEQGYEVIDKDTGMVRKLVWNANNFDAETNDELPEGFTERQIMAVKQEANRAFGYMDHDLKSLLFKEGITAVFMQFKTFATAKLSQWLLQPKTNDEGFYKQALDPVTKEPLYRKVI
ncbi:MAG: hypothetical protein Nk1A_8320 [Endomicrobiia bacterium]|nr:MAG: hypothetical protein Nk1A_8320 [Endomicrobiia bacterium]